MRELRLRAIDRIARARDAAEAARAARRADALALPRVHRRPTSDYRVSQPRLPTPLRAPQARATTRDRDGARAVGAAAVVSAAGQSPLQRPAPRPGARASVCCSLYSTL